VSQLGPNQPENVNKAVRELLTPTALENAVLLVYQATGNKESLLRKLAINFSKRSLTVHCRMTLFSSTFKIPQAV